jgi:hypothetical protein
MSRGTSCDEVRALAFEHRRGELDEPSAAMVDVHLSRCPACLAYRGSLERLMRTGAPEEPPPALVASLWERIEAALPPAEPSASRPPPGPAPRRAKRRAPVAAVAAVAAAGALLAAGWLIAAPDAASPEISVATLQRLPHARAARHSAVLAPETARDAAPSEPEALCLETDTPAPPEPRARPTEPPAPAPVARITGRKERRPTPPTAAPRAPLEPRAVANDLAPARERVAATEQLQREGRLSDAAARMEALLEEGALPGLEATSLRLELARLYERRLGQPRRAAHHLRQFLAAAPDDPAAASVFRELCRLAGLTGLSEPLCPVSVAVRRTPALAP